MDERLVFGLVGLTGAILYFNGVPQKAWGALWGKPTALSQGGQLPGWLGGGTVQGATGELGSGQGAPAGASPWSAVGDLAAGRIGIKEYANLCLAWAQNQAISAGALSTHKYDSALQAEQAGGLTNSCNAPKGAFVFFDTSWDRNGHVGVSEGDGTMVSALPGGVQRQPYCVNGFAGWSAPR